MSSIEFQLFRIKLIKPKQRGLFDTDLSSSDIFIRAINEKPTFELRKGFYWHIGNVEFIDDQSGYFAFGRTTKSIIEKYDNKTHNFIEEDSETSPYAHVLFDSKIGLLAISKKIKLAATIQGLSTKVRSLFEKTDIVSQINISCLIDPLKDPHTFVELLRKAYAITKFEATFVGPNPFDADEYFQKPMSVYLNEAKGEKGKTSIEGKDLDPGVIVEVSKSVASIGNKASARILQDEGETSRKINMGTNFRKFQVQEDAFDKRKVITEMRRMYQEIRE